MEGSVEVHIPSKKEILNFVRESNAIEGIFEDDNHPLVRDHISAIDYAIVTLQKGNLPIYSNIHRILLASESEKTPGLYRQCLMRVADHFCPPPALVEGLMVYHWDAVLNGPERMDIEKWIWNIHHEFLFVHPFIDGNGRVGRIGMNALRLWHGLSWITIRAEDRWEYYQRIRDYCKRVSR